MKSHLFYNLSRLFQNFYNKIEQNNLVKSLTYKNVKKKSSGFWPHCAYYMKAFNNEL